MIAIKDFKDFIEKYEPEKLKLISELNAIFQDHLGEFSTDDINKSIGKFLGAAIMYCIRYTDARLAEYHKWIREQDS